MAAFIPVREVQLTKDLGHLYGYPEERTAGVATTAIQVGRAMAYQAGELVILPTSATLVANLKGFTFYTSAGDLSESPGLEWPANKMMPLLRKGYIYVFSETATVGGEAAFIRFAVGAGGSLLGRVRNSADTATAAQNPRVTFDETIAASGLVRLRVNL